MNPEKLLELCSFSYLDLPECYQKRLQRGETVPLMEVVSALKRMDDLGALICGAYLDRAEPLLNALATSRLRIVDYINENQNTGLVAYAFLAPKNETIIAVRGSESTRMCVPTNVDWRDNFCAPIAGSVQYNGAKSFADQFATGSLLLTGHSKGANVALWTQSVAENPLARAAIFNGQGFARGELIKEQRTRMRNGAVNYVVGGDLIGALLYHPEIRFYVKQVPETNAHAPEAFAFDANGWPIPGRRTALSRVVEIVSRVLVTLERRGMSGLIQRLLNCPKPEESISIVSVV